MVEVMVDVGELSVYELLAEPDDTHREGDGFACCYKESPEKSGYVWIYPYKLSTLPPPQIRNSVLSIMWIEHHQLIEQSRNNCLALSQLLRIRSLAQITKRYGHKLGIRLPANLVEPLLQRRLLILRWSNNLKF